MTQCNRTTHWPFFEKKLKCLVSTKRVCKTSTTRNCMFFSYCVLLFPFSFVVSTLKLINGKENKSDRNLRVLWWRTEKKVSTLKLLFPRNFYPLFYFAIIVVYYSSPLSHCMYLTSSPDPPGIFSVDSYILRVNFCHIPYHIIILTITKLVFDVQQLKKKKALF